MPLIDHDGVKLHLQILEPRPSCRPRAAPALLLHGLLLGSMATWFFGLAPMLSGRRRVILYDLRGHGRSSLPSHGHTMDDHLGDLDAVIAACEIEGPIALVGHSFGGLVALHHALRAPAQVTALALVEMPLPPSQAGMLPNAEGQNGTEGTLNVPALLDALPAPLQAAVRGGSRRGKRFVERVRALCEDTDLLASLGAMGDLEDDLLSALQVSTLAVYGTRSSCLPTGERLARLIPRARLETLPGGHFLPQEAPTELSRIITEFLDA